jgi:Domain of unknown function (DUF4349)
VICGWNRLPSICGLTVTRIAQTRGSHLGQPEDTMNHLEQSARTPRRLACRRAVVAIATTAAIGVLLSACTNSDKKSSAAMSSAPAGESGAAAAYPTTAAAPASEAGPAPADSEAAGAAPAAASSAAAAPASEPPGSQAPGVTDPGTAEPLLTGRQVIFTADITVRTPNIKDAIGKVTQLATAQEGIVFGEQVDLAAKTPVDPASDNQNGPGNASATITLKVPPNTLENLLDQIGQVGTELSRDEHADDVTAQVVDVNARIGAAQDSLTRLRQLFQRAGNVADLTALEQQIAQRESDLDSLESQQRTFAAQTAQATITVNLVSAPPVVAPAPVVKKAHVVSFWRGLRGGWHALTHVASGVAIATGALLPFAAIIVVVGGIALYVRRRLTHRPSTAQVSDGPVS